MALAVQEAMHAFEQHDRANIHRGVHTLSQRATDAFERARSDLKRFVGAGPDHELVFTSGTTDALNMVAHGLSTAGHRSAWLQADDHHLLLPEHPGWPALLAETADAPALLYVAGNPALLERPQLAVVGSRRASMPGCDNARAFAASPAGRWR